MFNLVRRKCHLVPLTRRHHRRPEVSTITTTTTAAAEGWDTLPPRATRPHLSRLTRPCRSTNPTTSPSPTFKSASQSSNRGTFRCSSVCRLMPPLNLLTEATASRIRSFTIASTAKAKTRLATALNPIRRSSTITTTTTRRSNSSRSRSNAPPNRSVAAAAVRVEAAAVAPVRFVTENKAQSPEPIQMIRPNSPVASVPRASPSNGSSIGT